MSDRRQPREFEGRVEALRGFASILVGLSHLLALQIVDPHWEPGPPWSFLHAGHPGVLLFFLISGYVIGLTNKSKCTGPATRAFFQRRLRRLLPIYIVTWAGAYLLARGVPWWQAVANLCFLQNHDAYFGLRLLPIPTNGPSWSLNYEALYYALFPIIWIRGRNVLGYAIVGMSAAVAAWFLPHFPVFIGAYGCGALFWLTGWGLAQTEHQSCDSRTISPPWRILSPLLLLLAAFHFDAGRILLNGLGFRHDAESGMVNLSNLALFPACAACLIASISRRVPGSFWVKLPAAVIPVVCAIYLLVVHRLTENPRWVFAAACAGAGLLAWNVSTDWIGAAGQWFGSISYGFYLCHFPLLFLVRSLPLPTGTPATFALRAVLWAFLSVTTAWLLERRLQPFVVSRWGIADPITLAPSET